MGQTYTKFLIVWRLLLVWDLSGFWWILPWICRVPTLSSRYHGLEGREIGCIQLVHLMTNWIKYFCFRTTLKMWLYGLYTLSEWLSYGYRCCMLCLLCFVIHLFRKYMPLSVSLLALWGMHPGTLCPTLGGSNNYCRRIGCILWKRICALNAAQIMEYCKAPLPRHSRE